MQPSEKLGWCVAVETGGGSASMGPRWCTHLGREPEVLLVLHGSPSDALWSLEKPALTLAQRRVTLSSSIGGQTSAWLGNESMTRMKGSEGSVPPIWGGR